MNFLRSTYLVAWREATERARSRAYVVSTIFTVVLVGGLIAVVALTDTGGPKSYTVGRAGVAPPALATSIAMVATASDVLVSQTEYSDAAAARQAVADGDIDAAIVAGDTIVVKHADGHAHVHHVGPAAHVVGGVLGFQVEGEYA